MAPSKKVQKTITSFFVPKASSSLMPSTSSSLPSTSTPKRKQSLSKQNSVVKQEVDSSKIDPKNRCPWPECTFVVAAKRGTFNPYNLRLHYRTHTNSPIYQCYGFKVSGTNVDCTKTVTRVEKLRYHCVKEHGLEPNRSMPSKHIKINQELYDLESEQLGIQRRPVRSTIYGGDNPTPEISDFTDFDLPTFAEVLMKDGYYLCPICSKRRMSTADFMRHYRRHGNFRPSQCIFAPNSCNLRGFCNAEILQHLKIKHKYFGDDANNYVKESKAFLAYENELFFDFKSKVKCID